MLTSMDASHLSALIAEVHESEGHGYASKESLLALAEYMTSHRACVDYSVEEMDGATRILQRYHLAHLIKWPERIEAERKKPWIAKCRRCGRSLTDPESVARGMGPVCVHKAPNRRVLGKGGQVVLQSSGYNEL